MFDLSRVGVLKNDAKRERTKGERLYLSYGRP